MKGEVYASGRIARTSAKGESPGQGERWYVAEICHVHTCMRSRVGAK